MLSAIHSRWKLQLEAMVRSPYPLGSHSDEQKTHCYHPNRRLGNIEHIHLDTSLHCPHLPAEYRQSMGVHYQSPNPSRLPSVKDLDNMDSRWPLAMLRT